MTESNERYITVCSFSRIIITIIVILNTNKSNCNSQEIIRIHGREFNKSMENLPAKILSDVSNNLEKAHFNITNSNGSLKLSNSTYDFEPNTTSLVKHKHGKSLKYILENKPYYPKSSRANEIMEFKENIVKNATNNDHISNEAESLHANDGAKTISTPKSSINNQNNEVSMIRTVPILNTVTSISRYLLKVFGYELNKLLENGRAISNYSKISFVWSLLKAGLSIIATKGRDKKDHKGPTVLLSALISLGVLVPVAFSVVALMAKKALISSLVALALSVYALTHSKAPAVQGKQSYEADPPQQHQPSKYSDLKYNPPSAANVDYPSAPNLAYSFPYDDTKYFNSRPTKNEEVRNNGVYEHKIPSRQKSKGQNDHHSHIPDPTESNQYEVTERSDIAKNRRPNRVIERRPYDQDNYNTNPVPETYRPSQYDETNENRYRNVDSDRHPTTYDERRHGKEEELFHDRDLTKQIHEYYGTTERSNPTYQNSDSYRKGSNQNRKFNNPESNNEHTNTREENVNRNRHFSSKYANNKPAASEYSRNEHNSRYNLQTSEHESSDNVNRIEPLPTEPTVYSLNQRYSSETTDNGGYDDNINSEDVFKPMIVTTQLPKYNKKDAKLEESTKRASDQKDHPVTVNSFSIDNLLYQNLDEHEFKRPSPVYRPKDKENEENSVRSGVTLSYVPKIKSFTITSANSTN